MWCETSREPAAGEPAPKSAAQRSFASYAFCDCDGNFIAGDSAPFFAVDGGAASLVRWGPGSSWARVYARNKRVTTTGQRGLRQGQKGRKEIRGQQQGKIQSMRRSRTLSYTRRRWLARRARVSQGVEKGKGGIPRIHRPRFGQGQCCCSRGTAAIVVSHASAPRFSGLAETRCCPVHGSSRASLACGFASSSALYPLLQCCK